MFFGKKFGSFQLSTMTKRCVPLSGVSCDPMATPSSPSVGRRLPAIAAAGRNIVLDLRRTNAGMSGLELQLALMEQGKRIPVIFITAIPPRGGQSTRHGKRRRMFSRKAVRHKQTARMHWRGAEYNVTFDAWDALLPRRLKTSTPHYAQCIKRGRTIRLSICKACHGGLLRFSARQRHKSFRLS